MKLISVSVYGDKPMYLRGAVENALLLPEIFPGWKMRVYHDAGLDVGVLAELGCELKPMRASRKHGGMFWRFLPAWEEDLERVIFRDTDSRFNVREAAAVREWEESGLKAHCMHDHAHHRQRPIMGGMWGILPGTLPRKLHHVVLRMSRNPQRRVMDMNFLTANVHPIILPTTLRHSSVKVEWPSKPFPEHPEYDGFVGQQHEADGTPIWP